MASNLGSLNKQILLKLLLLAVLMFGFGYALVPLYKALCEVTGINVITSKNNYGVRAHGASKPVNTQVDYSRKITIEFDTENEQDMVNYKMCGLAPAMYLALAELRHHTFSSLAVSPSQQ